MPKETPKMPYIFGEPEGLERLSEEEREEKERLAGGELQKRKRKLQELKLKKSRFLPEGVEEHSLTDLEELASGELNPEQELELNKAIQHGFADIAQNPNENIRREVRTPEELKRYLEEKERRIIREKRGSKKGKAA